jgi:hypothetical protein
VYAINTVNRGCNDEYKMVHQGVVNEYGNFRTRCGHFLRSFDLRHRRPSVLVFKFCKNCERSARSTSRP